MSNFAQSQPIGQVPASSLSAEQLDELRHQAHALFNDRVEALMEAFVHRDLNKAVFDTLTEAATRAADNDPHFAAVWAEFNRLRAGYTQERVQRAARDQADRFLAHESLDQAISARAKDGVAMLQRVADMNNGANHAAR